MLRGVTPVVAGIANRCCGELFNMLPKLGRLQIEDPLSRGGCRCFVYLLPPVVAGYITRCCGGDHRVLRWIATAGFPRKCSADLATSRSGKKKDHHRRRLHVVVVVAEFFIRSYRSTIPPGHYRDRRLRRKPEAIIIEVIVAVSIFA